MGGVRIPNGRVSTQVTMAVLTILLASTACGSHLCQVKRTVNLFIYLFFSIQIIFYAQEEALHVMVLKMTPLMLSDQSEIKKRESSLKQTFHMNNR